MRLLNTQWLVERRVAVFPCCIAPAADVICCKDNAHHRIRCSLHGMIFVVMVEEQQACLDGVLQRRRKEEFWQWHGTHQTFASTGPGVGLVDQAVETVIFVQDRTQVTLPCKSLETTELLK
ncbi:hypothetical protein ACFX2G_030515 [Malus domestica]